ncbi:YqaA family protein [Limnobacter parvus]|uniref:VTT domain-containing protein n=1 Tax=Limnobacter parvus TaxID=2939690 RepID=A0ABT1XG05_9BURK|nr:VTT domain-containing protein [Limnobacter parvus]MCR2746205.1 VTT domain-containing protein [Limnobacter parvus]
MLKSFCEKLANSRFGIAAMCLLTYLGGFIFPVPSDVMLPPMIIGRPDRWKPLMIACVVFSVAGACSAYFLGFAFAGELATWAQSTNLEEINQATVLMAQYGSPILFVAAFAPIPFKTLALAAGAGAMPMALFLPAVVLGRTIRFYFISKVTLKGLKWMKHYKGIETKRT